MTRDMQLVQVIYAIPRSRRGWELSEEKMPESVGHDEAVELLKAILSWWARDRQMRIARNLAIRWDQAEPRIGVDPDVCVLSPAPPMDGRDLRSVRTWVPGHSAPLFAVEVVSETNPNKDYVSTPDKYAANGTRELCIFDPLLAGPTLHGGPFRLQLWQRQEGGRFVRVYAGDGTTRWQRRMTRLRGLRPSRRSSWPPRRNDEHHFATATLERESPLSAFALRIICTSSARSLR